MTEEAVAGLVQKGGAYPVTESVDERTYAVQANPPDTWVMQEETVLAQYEMDTGQEGEVLSTEANEPMGVVNVTVGPAGAGGEEAAAEEEETPAPKAASSNPPPKTAAPGPAKK